MSWISSEYYYINLDGYVKNKKKKKIAKNRNLQMWQNIEIMLSGLALGVIMTNMKRL